MFIEDTMPQAKTKLYFKDNSFELYLDDCRDFLNNFSKESVDMIFADPPYNLSNNGFTCHAGKRVSVNKGEWDESRGLDEDLKFHIEWIKACRRVLKPGGTIWISGTYHSIYRCGYALEATGYHILNDVAWFKPNASPNLSCRMFTASHETVLWVRKDKKSKHKFNYSAMKNGIWTEDFLKKPGKQMRSVWAIGTPKNGEKKYGRHPTQKPVELVKRIILAASEKNDLILDPFCGSGTTGVASILANRKFIGIDNDAGYLNNMAIPRIKEASLRKGLIE